MGTPKEANAQLNARQEGRFRTLVVGPHYASWSGLHALLCRLIAPERIDGTATLVLHIPEADWRAAKETIS